MTERNETNIHILAKFFPDMSEPNPTGLQFNRNFKNRKLVTQFYTFKGRKVWVEKDDREWIGGFVGHDDVEYQAKTKRELLWDLESDA